MNRLSPATHTRERKMKSCVITAVLACAFVSYVATNPTPARLFLPRLPPSVLLKGFPIMLDDKLVDGTPVQPNSLPFQVSLQRRGLSPDSEYIHICGGTILDALTVLSAVHCLQGIRDVSRLRVVAGEHSLSVDSGLEEIATVSNIYMHEAFDDITYENDIALVFLDIPLSLGLLAQSINLPPPTSIFDPPVGTMTTVSGWGSTKSGGPVSDVLLSVDVPVVSDIDCDQAYNGNVTNPAVFSSMLCAGDITSNGRINYCQGDSGGPLFTGTGSDAVQLGIVSWGQGCAQGPYPGVYTQVSYFLDWIAANRIESQWEYKRKAIFLFKNE